MAENEKNSGLVIDELIGRLDLAPAAKAAAYELKRLHPSVKTLGLTIRSRCWGGRMR